MSSLNAFQELMREWAALAPYNFAHAMRIDASPDVDRWHRAAVKAAGELDLDGSAIPIEQPNTTIDEHLNAELNRAFAPADLPLRFFVLPASDGGHWFGVVIDHWFADDFSCRCLLERIHSLYCATSAAADAPLSRVNSRRRSQWLRGWIVFLRHAGRLRRAKRVPLRNATDFSARTFRVELPFLERVRALAKEHRATVHDVFIAAALRACAAAGKWQPSDHRDAVAIATAMDLRRFESGDARRRFGLLLSEYTVVEQRPELRTLEELVARIAPQTKRFKAAPSADFFGPALAVWRLSRSAHAKATLFPRGAPMALGLSNVNLTGSWIENSEVVDYRRVGPTGTIVPILFMMTTLRGRILIDVTFRTAAFTRAEAEVLVTEFARCLSTADGAEALPASAR